MTLKELNEFALANGLPEDVKLWIAYDYDDQWYEVDNIEGEVIENVEYNWDEERQLWIDSRGEKQLSICCKLGKQHRDELGWHPHAQTGT